MDGFELHPTRAGDAAERHALARAAVRGVENRLRRGVYADAEGWERLDRQQQAIQRIHAAALVSTREAVFSHWSAAALLGLPSGVRPEARVHRSVVADTVPSQRGVCTHLLAVPDDDRAMIDGLPSTSIARTAVDVAAAASFEDGVIVADAALRMLGLGTLAGRELLRDAWARAQPRRAVRKVERVIAFADALAESPNESVSRATMQRIGLPAPVMQHEFFDRRGFVARTDFFLPELRLIGEADGKVKYLDPRLTKSEAAKVLYDEKLREDRLRALGFAVLRWGWREAISPRELSAVFRGYLPR